VIPGSLTLLPAAGLLFMLVFMTGLLAIPIGYERGKVKWLMWCGSGMHAHTVYLTEEHGFQTLHPDDRTHR